MLPFRGYEGSRRCCRWCASRSGYGAPRRRRGGRSAHLTLRRPLAGSGAKLVPGRVPHHQHDQELPPNDRETRATVKDRLRQRHEVHGGRRVEDCREPRRHALERCIAAGKHCQWQIDQQVEQAELRHLSRDGAEEEADRSGEEQIDSGAEEKQWDRSGDRDTEEPAHDEIK